MILMFEYLFLMYGKCILWFDDYIKKQIRQVAMLGYSSIFVQFWKFIKVILMLF
jgi:hypothetical protein